MPSHLGSRSISKFRQSALILGVALSLFGSGCGAHVRYLAQASYGQFVLLNRARPIAEVLQDERTPLRVRNLLKEIDPVKSFGEAQGLRPTHNYTEYVKLDRDAAVWVVSACEKLKFESKEWNFPIAGAFPYLGWFDLQTAQEFAEELRKEGWDVDLRGAQAYSTLGWFRDSVLSTMIPPGEGALSSLVNVVLHESVHATLY
ncbi:MAG: aminopeptidase, partial [Bdellovibrio sp.]|nr:aminopeptidase [Bdellovibrio sp.]